MNIIILDATETLLNEIASNKFKQKDISLTYSLAIMSNRHTNFKKVNEAIIKRWSIAGLISIKEAAWKNIALKNPIYNANNR